MTYALILRVSVFANADNQAVMDVATDGTIRRFQFADAHAVLDAAEKLRLVGNSMLRFAERPTP